MGEPRAARPVKLIVGLLSGDSDLLRRVRQLLARHYGPVDLASDLWPFDQTDYYRDEMGGDLLRAFITFDSLMRPEALTALKRHTNELEQQIIEDTLAPVPRPVNIDPGYIDLNKLVLASTKDSSHRIYLGGGVYGEVTLRFVNGAWQECSWTYPDYRRPEYHAFFTRVRDCYREQRRALLDASPPEPGGNGR